MTESFSDQPAAFSSRRTLSASALLSKNVRIHDRRTSVRLEPEMWVALNEIAAAEKCSIHDLCGAVHDLKEPATSFTAALRVFLMEYYRSAAKSSPHVNNIRQQLHKTQEPAVTDLPRTAAEGGFR